MKYRFVVQITDEQGAVREEARTPEVASESGWRCDHGLWPEWTKDELATECGWCKTSLVACEIVECPRCEWYVTIEDAVEHSDEGCDE